MKKYFAPEIEIVSFKACDIVTISGGGEIVEPTTLNKYDADHPASLNGMVGYVQ